MTQDMDGTGSKDAPQPKPDATMGPIMPDATSTPFVPDATNVLRPPSDPTVPPVIPDALSMPEASEKPVDMENMHAKLPPEKQAAMQIIQDRTKTADERYAAGKQLGLPTDHMAEFLRGDGVDEQTIQRLTGGEKPRSMSDIIDEDDAVPADKKEDAKEAMSEIKSDIADIQSILAKPGPLSKEDEDHLEELKNKKWLGEKLDWLKKPSSWLKIFTSTFLAILIAYIWLLKTYAGAAAKKGR